MARSHEKFLSLGQVSLGLLLASQAACVVKDEIKTSAVSVPDVCAPSSLSVIATDSGSGKTFFSDPITASGNQSLLPNSSGLDAISQAISLTRLTGHGVLHGELLEVRNGLDCQGWFRAFDTKQRFEYLHSDPRFQEASSYYWGDQYRSYLKSLGYLDSTQESMTVFAHCELNDNAFYSRGTTSSGNVRREVCLGDSVATPGASYADDASVLLHELQHATTTDNYASNGRLNQFWYDEAGSLNEAISDFFALVYLEPQNTHGLDSKVFSRWALGSFIPRHSGIRGAHRCPVYDPSYPNCGQYPQFSATNSTVSFVYPDGLGWPYPNNSMGPSYLNEVYASFKGQEEIHNNGILLEGALWDVYEAIKSYHSSNPQDARDLVLQLVLESIRHLPKPTIQSVSPVTFRGLAQAMVTYASAVGLSASEQSAMVAVLTDRGLLGGTQLTSQWGAVGPGNVGVTPGVRVVDNPVVLKTWLINLTNDIAAGGLIPQGIDTGLNSRLDAGELALIWFDLQNVEAVTAGGVQLTVTSLDNKITFDPDLNLAVLDNANQMAQIQYYKVNGTSIVADLASNQPSYHVPTANHYFKTNPFFDRTYKTGRWVRVSQNAAHGDTVTLRVQAKPSNGLSTTVDFPVVIR